MAVLPMKKASICGLQKDRKKILEMLQRRGVVEISDQIEQDSVFSRADMSSAQATFEKNIATATAALSVLDRYATEKKPMLAALQGRQAISVDRYDSFADVREETMKHAYRLCALDRQLEEGRAEIPKLQTQIDGLLPWSGLDVPLHFKGTKTTSCFIGTLPGEWSLQALLERLGELAPDASRVHADIITADKEQTRIFLLCPQKHAHLLEDALRQLNFARPPADADLVPAERIRQLEDEIQSVRQQLQDAEEEIRQLAAHREDIRFAVDYYQMRAEKYGVIGRLAQSKRTFFVTGYVPQRDTQRLCRELEDQYDAAVYLEDPLPEDDVPVLLQNNKFAEPVEGVLESFSLPGKGEMDPTSVTAIFYYVLFGLMLSDAAYGLMLVIGCGLILLKFKNIEQGLQKMLRMFFFCGISTTFWGIVFSSYFGDVVNVVSRTFFGHEVGIPPLWFTPLEKPMQMLLFCLAIGIVHLFAGLAMKLYQQVKAGQYKDALYDVIFWYMLLGGLILWMLSMQKFADIVQLSFVLPSAVGTVSCIVAGVGAVGIILTSGRESKNPVKRLLKGLYGLYGVTGYLSDILSYSRLLALGLATGVIGSVINQMGSMVGGGAVGAVVFILVFIVGHTLNFGIELLGAYVHTNRLQFVEFFGKFYEGGGRKFDPFAVHTKYYKFREDNENE